MSGEVGARITQIREAAGNISSSANRINDAIEAAESEVRALSPDRFMSEAAEEFRAQYARMTPRLREAHRNLLTFRDSLNGAADELERATSR